MYDRTFVTYSSAQTRLVLHVLAKETGKTQIHKKYGASTLQNEEIETNESI